MMRPYAPVVDADPAFEARAKATYLAVLRPGRDYVLPLRWVDVMPQVTGPSLLCPGRDSQRLGAWLMTHERPVEDPVYIGGAHKRELAAARGRRYYHAHKAGPEAMARIAEEREAEKAALRTPEQQKKHDDYIARRDARKVSGQ